MATSLFMGRCISTGFVNYASQITINNVETLGVLIGKVDDKKKRITCKKVAASIFRVPSVSQNLCCTWLQVNLEI